MNATDARGRVERSRNCNNSPSPMAAAEASDHEDLLTTAEVAAICRTSESTVRYWRHRGVGPYCYKLRRRVVYPRHRVNLWLREQQAQDAARRP